MLPKSTQCGWLKEAGALCIRVVDAMFDESRTGAFVVATDATSTPVLPARLKGEAKAEAAQLWPVERRACDASAELQPETSSTAPVEQPA